MSECSFEKVLLTFKIQGGSLVRCENSFCFIPRYGLVNAQMLEVALSIADNVRL